MRELARAILGLMSGLIAAAKYHAATNETSELYVQATHDALTGLANRNLFLIGLNNDRRKVAAIASRSGYF